MTRMLIAIAVVVVTLVVAAAPASAATRTHLWTAMHRYAACRVVSPHARLAGDLSAADQGRVTYETLMTNKSALVVNAGPRQRHRVRWITSNGVVQHLFTFGRLREVASRLNALCKGGS